MKIPPPTLQELVQRHAVGSEVWPHEEIVRGQRLITGFDVELHGAHAGGRTRLSPGCGHCVDPYRALRELAARALPSAHSLSSVEIAPFDNSLYVSSRRGPAVVLTVRIRHRWGRPRPIEESERLCLNDMRERLAALCVRNGR